MDHVVSVEEISQQPQEQQQTLESQMEAITGAPKKNLLPWKILCLVLAVLVTLGWIGIIVLLILKEEWQLVMVAWLMLYAAGHFCYWYCRRHSTSTLSAQIREQVGRIRGQEVHTVSGGDCPPSYDELVKSEVPPPAYYTVVDETPKRKRMLQVNSLALPWFLKKKSLEQQTAAAAAAAAAGSTSEPSTSSANQQEESGAWKSSCSGAAVVVCDLPVATMTVDDDEEPIQLPSYDTLMREAVQPVLTPIHQALASMPSLPPPYSPNPVHDSTTTTE